MRAKILILCLSCAVLVDCSKQEENPSQATGEIKALFARWKTAFEAKDAPGARLVAYDIVPPLQFNGADAYRKDYADFFGQFAGPLHVDLPDMRIEANGDVAFAYGVERLTGKLTSGAPIDIWMRYTEGLKRTEGQWRVVHEHISVPVDMGSGKARLDLKP